MFLNCEGWHDKWSGEKVAFTDWGGFGERWLTVDADGKTWQWTGQGFNAKGEPIKWEGKMSMADDNTMDWSWSKWCPDGTKKTFEGTSKRQS
jgi:hypothetical protein